MRVVQHLARHVRCFGKAGIPDHIQIGEARDSERVAQAASAGFLNVRQDFEVLGDLKSCVQRQHTGCSVFGVGFKTIWAAIFGRKVTVLLPDEIGLAGDPESIPKRIV